MVLQHVEDGGVVHRNAVDPLRQQVRAQLVRDSLAHQPQPILSEPAIGGFRLIQLQLFLEQEAQPVQQLALQRVPGRGHGARGIAAQFLCHRSAISLHDQFTQHAGVLVLPGQDVEQWCPQRWIAHGDGRFAKLMSSYAKTDLLIPDDWGLAPFTGEQRRDMLELLDDRYGQRSTVVTSQMPVDNWHELIGDPTLADAILDRLVHNAYRINLKGESMRKRTQKLTTPANPD